MFRTGLASSSSGLRRALHKWGAAVVVVAGLAAGGVATEAAARTPENPLQGQQGQQTPALALATLPQEAQATYRLILAGGPFPYDKDGTVFGNRERLLPSHPRGYYREYTVKTPGLRHRGARRIVCGGIPPTRPDTCFYTSDHYASFQRIAP